MIWSNLIFYIISQSYYFLCVHIYIQFNVQYLSTSLCAIVFNKKKQLYSTFVSKYGKYTAIYYRTWGELDTLSSRNNLKLNNLSSSEQKDSRMIINIAANFLFKL